MERSSFGECTLSEDTSEKIALLKHQELLQIAPLIQQNAWKTIAGEHIAVEENENEIPEEIQRQASNSFHGHQATQFHFSQNRSINQSFNAVKTQFSPSQEVEQSKKVVDSLDNFMRSKKVEWEILDNMSDDEIGMAIDFLGTNMNIVDICNAMCSMNAEQKMKYFSLLCSRVVLHQFTEMKEPSRLLNTSLRNLVQEFPDNVRKSLFIPLINSDVKNPKVVSTLVDSFGVQKKPDIFFDFLQNVNEIKEWHLVLLQSFILIEMEDKSKDNLVQMLLDKATIFAKDKTFGQLLLQLCRSAAPFSERALKMLKEIASVHKTSLKKPVESILNKY